MKKIYIICTSLNIGGTEMQSVWLANMFSSKGYEVTFVVLKKGIVLKKFLHSSVNLIEYKMYATNEKKSFIFFRKIFNFFNGILLFRKKIKQEEGVVFSLLFHSNIFGFLSTIFTKNKHYICVRNDRFSSRASTKNLNYRSFLISLISYFSSGVIFNSEIALQKIGPKISKKNTQKVIFNTVVRLDNQIDIENENKISNFLGDSKTNFVSVGRLEALKNYETAILAMNNLKNLGIEFKYVIFGEGYQKTFLQDLVVKNNLQNNILIFGSLENSINYLHYFKYFLMTSVHEGFPNSLIEAMSSNLIPFCTQAGDSFNIIRDNRGIKLLNNSPQGISQTIFEHIKIHPKSHEDDILSNIHKFINNDLNSDFLFNEWETLI